MLQVEALLLPLLLLFQAEALLPRCKYGPSPEGSWLGPFACHQCQRSQWRKTIRSLKFPEMAVALHRASWQPAIHRGIGSRGTMVTLLIGRDYWKINSAPKTSS